MKNEIKANDRVRVTRGVFKGQTGDVEKVEHFGNTTMVTVYLDARNASRCRIIEGKSSLKVISK